MVRLGESQMGIKIIEYSARLSWPDRVIHVDQKKGVAWYHLRYLVADPVEDYPAFWGWHSEDPREQD